MASQCAPTCREQRGRLFELVQRYRRGELVPREVVSFADATLAIAAVLIFHGVPLKVTFELDWTAPLNATEARALDRLDGLMALRDHWLGHPAAELELAQQRHAEAERRLTERVQQRYAQAEARLIEHARDVDEEERNPAGYRAELRTRALEKQRRRELAAALMP